MRHRKSGRQLNRNSSHRKALMKNLTLSLFEYEKITTSLPKAKELRRVAEPLITLAKEDTLIRRRLAYSKIRSKKLVKKLFEDLELKYKEITIQKKMNTNVSSGYSETIISDFFISKFENFKKKIPEKIKEKVPEFFDYDRL